MYYLKNKLLIIKKINFLINFYKLTIYINNGSDISTQSKDKSTIIKKSSPSKKPVIKKPVIKKPVIKKNRGGWLESTNFSIIKPYTFTFNSKETTVTSNNNLNQNYYIKLNFITKFMFFHYLESIVLSFRNGTNYPDKKIFIHNYELKDKTEYTINIELSHNNKTNKAINRITKEHITVKINDKEVNVLKVV